MSWYTEFLKRSSTWYKERGATKADSLCCEIRFIIQSCFPQGAEKSHRAPSSCSKGLQLSKKLCYQSSLLHPQLLLWGSVTQGVGEDIMLLFTNAMLFRSAWRVFWVQGISWHGLPVTQLQWLRSSYIPHILGSQIPNQNVAEGMLAHTTMSIC